MKITLSGEEARYIFAASVESGHAPDRIKQTLESIYNSNLYEDISYAVECLNEDELQESFIALLASR